MTNEMFTENTSLQHHKKIANHSDFQNRNILSMLYASCTNILPYHALENQLRFQLFHAQFSRDSYNFPHYNIYLLI